MKKTLKFILIFSLVLGWVFSGWPKIWQNPRIPPEIQIAQAATLEYVGGASGTGTGATYSVSLTGLTGGIGSSAAAGDLVIVVTGWASAADGNPGVTTPTGYTEVYDLYKSDTRDVNMSVNWKIMGGTPDTSVTVSGHNNAANGGATVVHVWRGVDSTTPMDVTPPTGVTAANASSPDSPSITPVTSGAYVLSVGMGTGDTTPLTKTAPTGYGNALSVAGNGSTMSIIANIASKVWSGSGAEDPAAWTGGETSTSDSWAAGTLAIRPAPSFTQSAYRFFNNIDSTDVGSVLANQDTSATLSSSGAEFRLRMLLHIGTSRLDASGQQFKLQFAQMSGTCDTVFSGESYADVTAATVIAYNNNTTPADGDNLTANANDPIHGADTIVNQDYEELNNFTNSVAAIPSGQDGKWDFSLKDNGASAETAYCFRAVLSDGTLFTAGGGSYSVVPEITTASANSAPTVSNVVLNNLNPITLTPNTTTAVLVVASTTDSNNNISYATGTIYRTGIGATCAADNLNCYQLASSSCSFSGSTSTVTCSANIWYFAQATDSSSSFSGDTWSGKIAVTDSGGLSGSSSTASQVELNTLLAIDVTSGTIDYGTLVPNTNTGSTNQTSTVKNVGNSSTTLQLSASQTLTSGSNSITTSSQHYATSSFTFGGSEAQLSDTPTTVTGFSLTSPTSTNAVSSIVYWGLNVPASKPTGTYSGINVFTAVFVQ
ncbi:MAG: hypothetical protein QMD50_00420 [Patescibacteria group bacterium]|nr:hypothetical protein [Patescibacteria group bacterium]